MLHFPSTSEVDYQLYSLILLKELMMVVYEQRRLHMQRVVCVVVVKQTGPY